MRQAFLDFSASYILGNNFFFQSGQIFIILSLFLLLRELLKKKINSAYVRDTLTMLVLIAGYVFFKLWVYSPFRSNSVRSFDMSRLASIALSGFVMTQLYFVFRKVFIRSAFSFGKAELIRFGLIFTISIAHSYADMELAKLLESRIWTTPARVTTRAFPDSLRMIQFFSVISFSLLLALINFLLNAVRYKTGIKQQQKELELARTRNQLLRSQLEGIEARLNPHFLYNSLNSIAALTYEDPSRSREMAIALSHFFRQQVNHDQQHLSTVQQEIALTRLYLDIEKIRFGERLQFRFDIADGTANALLPKFIFQPLLENAIKHGWIPEQKTLTIDIRVRYENSRLMLVVADNGRPFRENFTLGYGIRSTFEKLDILFPGRYEFQICRIPEKELIIYLEQHEDLPNSDH